MEGLKLPNRSGILVTPVIKRAIDITGAAVGLILLSPVMLVAAVIVRMTMGDPVFFRQARPGKDAKPFTLLKFRTMNDQFDAAGMLAPDAERLTRFGKWLRATSIDELPQLWNVLMGDLSLVGPRPLLMRYLPRYSEEQARRHEVKPGITGWAQVNGRNAITWEEKFKLDVWYVDHQNVFLDLRILAMTLSQSLRREGISSSGHVTMPEFMGSAMPTRAAGAN